MSEGELLRNQIADLCEEAMRETWDGERLPNTIHIANRILARFDVRLRVPQAEERLTRNTFPTPTCPDCGHYETSHAPANAPHFSGCEACGCERKRFEPRVPQEEETQ